MAQISTGSSHTCGVRRDTETAECWGYNGEGRAAPPATLGRVTMISNGYINTCAVQASTQLAICWGGGEARYANGQSAVPLDLGNVTSVDAGAFHACAVRNDV